MSLVPDDVNKKLTSPNYRQHVLELTSDKYGIDKSKLPKDNQPAAHFRKLSID